METNSERIDALPDNAILTGGNPADFPPWTAAQRDAQIEALRYAFLRLASALHRNGTLDTATLQPDLDEAEVWFQDEPDTRAAVCYLAETLAYMRLKQGPAPKRPARTSGRG